MAQEKNYKINDIIFTENPYEWETVKAYVENDNCEKQYTKNYDEPIENIIQEEKWQIVKGDEKKDYIIIIWYSDGSVACEEVTTVYKE